MSDHQRYTREFERLQYERDKYRDEAHVLTAERDAALGEVGRLKHYSGIRDGLLEGLLKRAHEICDAATTDDRGNTVIQGDALNGLYELLKGQSLAHESKLEGDCHGQR